MDIKTAILQVLPIAAAEFGQAIPDDVADVFKDAIETAEKMEGLKGIEKHAKALELTQDHVKAILGMFLPGNSADLLIKAGVAGLNAAKLLGG